MISIVGMKIYLCCLACRYEGLQSIGQIFANKKDAEEYCRIENKKLEEDFNMLFKGKHDFTDAEDTPYEEYKIVERVIE